MVSILERDKLPANRVADQAALDAQRVALERADKTNEKLEKEVEDGHTALNRVIGDSIGQVRAAKAIQ